MDTAALAPDRHTELVPRRLRHEARPFLIATSLVIAGRFAVEGRRAWAWFYGAAILLVFMALAAVGLVVGVNPAAPAFLATPWIWVTALAVHLHRREATRPCSTG